MKKINHIIILSIIAFSCNMLSGQVGINTPNPNQESLLELYSDTKGFLPVRLSLASITSAAPLSQHVKGMVVYNITNNATISEGLYVNNGKEWLRLSTADTPIGNIKYSVQTADHNGWYLLNGRAVSLFPSRVQSNAASMGFITNIPDATNRYLKAKTGTEILGSAGGNASFSLVQANLPPITYNTTTGLAYGHIHFYTDSGSTTVSAGTTGADNMQADNSFNNYFTDPAGDHNHTFSVSTGGSNQPVSINPKNTALNIFIYLGQ